MSLVEILDLTADVFFYPYYIMLLGSSSGHVQMDLWKDASYNMPQKTAASPERHPISRDRAKSPPHSSPAKERASQSRRAIFQSCPHGDGK